MIYADNAATTKMSRTAINAMLPYIRQAAGVITEESGTSSHAAIVALTLDKAVIVGALGATRTLHDGMNISIDCEHGVVQQMME